jgi:hypothetical protein
MSDRLLLSGLLLINASPTNRLVKNVISSLSPAIELRITPW